MSVIPTLQKRSIYTRRILNPKGKFDTWNIVQTSPSLIYDNEFLVLFGRIFRILCIYSNSKSLLPLYSSSTVSVFCIALVKSPWNDRKSQNRLLNHLSLLSSPIRLSISPPPIVPPQSHQHLFSHFAIFHIQRTFKMNLFQ